MKITTSYTVPVRGQLYMRPDSKTKKEKQVLDKVDDKLMSETSALCLKALWLCADVCLSEWDFLSTVPVSAKKGQTCRKREADKLVHGTKANKAKYPEFDVLAADMPSYTRRAIVADALGMVSSYKSNHLNWEETPAAKRGEEPTLGFPERYELTFYKQERDLENIEKGIIGLKLYDGKSWKWYQFLIAPSDARYIYKTSKTLTASSRICL